MQNYYVQVNFSNSQTVGARYKLQNDNFNTYVLHYVGNSSGLVYRDKLNTVKLKTGFLYLYPFNVDYSLGYETESDDNFYTHTWFNFVARPSLSDTIMEFDVDKNEILKSVIFPMKKIARDCFYKNQQEYVEARNDFVSFILHLCNVMSPFKIVKNSFIEKTIKFIHENISDDLSIERLTHICAMNRTYFYNEFVDQIHFSPHKYIVHVRMLKAQELLKSNLKLADICKKVGYEDEKSFSRAFKSYTLVSPEYFRKNCGIIPPVPFWSRESIDEV